MIIRVKFLDPDQAHPFAGPDLGTNCLQKLYQMWKVISNRESYITSNIFSTFLYPFCIYL